MSHYIVSVSEDIAQQVSEDARTPADRRFVKVEADSAKDAFRRARFAIEVNSERRKANRVLQLLLKHYPPAEQVEARCFTWSKKSQPTVADLNESKRDLAGDIERYEELRARGGDAVSDFDLTISSRSGPRGLELALSLKHAHISWNRGKIAYIEKRVSEQLSMPDLLTTYTRRDLEAKQPKDEPPPPALPAGPSVKIVQVDLFNDQSSLFGHVVQPGDLT